jgi:membrane-associated protease RseP (regulator of RpoE activity)
VTETLWYLGGILFIALGIGFSIGLHEIGHLAPAKKFGVKVPNYAIGFGPTLFKVTRGETTYAIKLIPLGGYITMLGMYPPAKPGSKPRKGFFGDMVNQARAAHSQYETPADANRKFYQLSVPKRLVIMFGGPFMNLILGVVLMILVLCGIGSVQQSTTITQVAPCVIVDVSERNACIDSDPASPAELAGIKAGDKLVSVGGVAIDNWQQLSQNLRIGAATTIIVERNGTQESIQVQPIAANRPKFDANGSVVLDANGQPVLEERAVIGVVLGTERKPESLTSALEKSAWSVGQVGQMIVTLPQQLTDVALATFTGAERSANGAVSVVGIAQISGTAAANDSVDLVDKLSTGLLILASLNFALFAFNMLPLLPLDGGHIAGGIYESIKRGAYRLAGRPAPGPADTALLMPITWFVFIALMAMSALLILADLVNPISL